MHKKVFVISVILSLFLFGFIAAIYANDTIWFEKFDKIDELLWPHQLFLSKLRSNAGKLIDEITFLHNEKTILSSLDVFDLLLSTKDVNALLVKPQREYQAAGFKKPAVDFRKIEVRYKNKSYKAKMRLHGDGPDHWIGKQKSFQLKFPKGQYLNHKARYLFIIPQDRHYVAPMFACAVAKRLGLVCPENDLVAVRINGVFQGIYYMEERISAKLLEQHQISNGVIVKLTDNWVEDRRAAQFDASRYFGGITYNDHHTTPFNYEISNVDEIKSEYAPAIYNKVKDLFEAIQKKDVDAFEDLVDLKRVAAIDAWRVLLGERHALAGDNNVMVYQLTSGKFFFIARSEGDSHVLEYKGGSFESTLNQKAGRVVPLFELLMLSRKIKHMRNEWLYYFISHEQELLSEYDRMIKRYLPILKRDTSSPYSSRELAYKLRQQRNDIKKNLTLLKEQFEYAKAYVNAEVKSNHLDLTIITDSSFQKLALSRLKVRLDQNGDENKKERLRIMRVSDPKSDLELLNAFEGSLSEDMSPFFSQEQFDYDFDDELLPKPRRHRYRIIFDDRDKISVKEIQIGFKTTLSKIQLLPDDIYLKMADANQDLSFLRKQSVQDFLSRYTFLNWELSGNQLKLRRGHYKIQDHVVVPDGVKVVIEGGVQFEISPGKVFLSYSSVDLLGTEIDPIKIYASDPQQPFGTFALVGDGTETAHLNYVEVSGGNEAFLNGIYFSGALCLYHTNVEMNHVYIHDNRADDGLNVKYGTTHIYHSKFVNNFADQIDLDFCNGVISESSFLSTLKKDHLNGDGLDLSGSKMIIRDSSFKGFQDKGISVGEDSNAVIWRNKITDNNIGIAVKDSSRVFIQGNHIINNQIGVSSYEKKEIFSGGNAYLAFNEWRNNGKPFTIDKNSKMFKPTDHGTSYLNSLNPGDENVSLEQLFAPENWTVA